MLLALRELASVPRLVVIAACVQRARHVLVARRPGRRFEWTGLGDASLIIPSDLPTPWIVLREALRVRKVSTDGLRLLIGFSGSSGVGAFREGVGDYLLTNIESVRLAGGTEVASLAVEGGRLPWSVFMASERVMESDPGLFSSFRAALARAQTWLSKADAQTVSDLLAVTYPIKREHLERAIHRYQELDIWAANPRVERADVEAWQQTLVRSGLLAKTVDVNSFLIEIDRIAAEAVRRK
ncbi:MAG TPA: hypothetical protein VMV09_07005 [Candidatus Saccharimonadales bacterium]|nr:hypothetical protein [Candidatus Saccharimonadales bacterium]